MTRRNPAAGSERERTDVAAHQQRAVLQLRPPQPLPPARQHLRGSVDPDDVRAGADDGDGDASRAAPELEHRAVLGRGQPLPERDVPARDRARVLPVVERRVGVPAFPTLCACRHPRKLPTSNFQLPKDMLVPSG